MSRKVNFELKESPIESYMAKTINPKAPLKDECNNISMTV